jgi:hypothetical protein
MLTPRELFSRRHEAQQRTCRRDETRTLVISSRLIASCNALGARCMQHDTETDRRAVAAWNHRAPSVRKSNSSRCPLDEYDHLLQRLCWTRERSENLHAGCLRAASVADTGMAFELRTEIDVAAPAARVWAVLSDFARYPEWNPFVKRIEGRLEVGSKLSVRLKLSGGRAVPIRPRLTTLIPGQAFAWQGELLSRALFVGEHRFEVIPSGDGARFVHSERFNGVLVPLLEKTLNTQARKGFEAMNRALKSRAETSA